MKRMVVGTQSSLLSPPYRSTTDTTKTALIILQYACPRGGLTESKTCLASRMVAFYHHQWNLTTLDVSLRMRSTSMWFAPSRNVWTPPKKLSDLSRPLCVVSWRFVHHISSPRFLAPGQRQITMKKYGGRSFRSIEYRASAYHQSSRLPYNTFHACIGHEFRKIVSVNPQLENYL